jgi:hypothetical protein
MDRAFRRGNPGLGNPVLYDDQQSDRFRTSSS